MHALLLRHTQQRTYDSIQKRSGRKFVLFCVCRPSARSGIFYFYQGYIYNFREFFSYRVIGHKMFFVTYWKMNADCCDVVVRV